MLLVCSLAGEDGMNTDYGSQCEGDVLVNWSKAGTAAPQHVRCLKTSQRWLGR